MAGLEAKNFDSPDEVRPFADKGEMKVVTVAGTTVGKGTFEPGWRWSDHVKPIAQTDSSEVPHLGYVLSGRMKVVMNDGTEGVAGPGDVVSIAPGHDAWIEGDEPCELLDFGGLTGYAQS